MKNKNVTLAAVFLLLVLAPASAFAQGWNKGAGGSSCVSRDYVSVEDLRLGKEQRATIERIEKDYSGRIESLRGKLMTKRLELQSLFRNPRADVQTIRARAREVIDLQSACQQLSVDYQIEVRALLTPEQIGKWYTPTESCLPTGWRR